VTVNYELESMWKEAKWLSRLRRTKRFSVMIDSNQTIISNEFHKYESEMLVLQPTF